MMSEWLDVTPAEVEKWLKEKKEVQFIDVREEEEYRVGHIEGVKLIPLTELKERKDEIDKGKETVLICRSGNRSSHACSYLSSLGHTKLFNMVGGMLNWEGEVKVENGQEG